MSLKLMKLNVFYGDTKHGNVVDCDSFEDAEKLIRESTGKGFANIVLNNKKYPKMQIKINSDWVFVMYDGAVGECIEEFDDCADDDTDDDVKADMYYNDNFYFPSWFSRGKYGKPVKFLAGHFKKLRATEAHYIITLEQAIECVKQFYINKSRSESIKWERIM